MDNILIHCPFKSSLPLHGREPERTIPANYWQLLPGLRWNHPGKVHRSNHTLPSPLCIPKEAINLVSFAHIFQGAIWQIDLDESKIIVNDHLRFGTPLIFFDDEPVQSNHGYRYHLTRIRLCRGATCYVEAVAFNEKNTIQTEGSLLMPPIILLLPTSLLQRHFHLSISHTRTRQFITSFTHHSLKWIRGLFTFLPSSPSSR
jgi:hypothetical protein